MSSPIRFFIDFDGTITTVDVVDLLLERFAAPEWKAVEEEWASGMIGSRECLLRQVALIKASPDELKTLLNDVELDPHFLDFLRFARRSGVPVAVVSDGFDWVIRQVLGRCLSDTELESLPVYSNRLVWEGGKPVVSFGEEKPCEHACANCKPAIMKRLRGPNETVVFVGDGLSDRFAAKEAAFAFSKGKLSLYCRENNIRHRPYADFKDIREWLAKYADNHAVAARLLGRKDLSGNIRS